MSVWGSRSGCPLQQLRQEGNFFFPRPTKGQMTSVCLSGERPSLGPGPERSGSKREGFPCRTGCYVVHTREGHTLSPTRPEVPVGSYERSPPRKRVSKEPSTDPQRRRRRVDRSRVRRTHSKNKGPGSAMRTRTRGVRGWGNLRQGCESWVGLRSRGVSSRRGVKVGTAVCGTGGGGKTLTRSGLYGKGWDRRIRASVSVKSKDPADSDSVGPKVTVTAERE